MTEQEQTQAARLQDAEARLDFYRTSVFPLIRDVLFLVAGFSFFALLILTGVQTIWPYVIVGGLFGFPGWLRLVAPLLTSGSKALESTAKAIDTADPPDGPGP